MRLLRTIPIAAAALVVVLLAVVGFSFLTRRAPSRAVLAVGGPSGPPAADDSAFIHMLSLHTGAPAAAGHRVDFLLNGDGTFPQLWRDLRAARRVITFQTYYAHPGEVADSVSAILRERARAGVAVHFLYDAFGAGPLSDGWLDSLRTAGVRVAELRPVRWYSPHKATARSHARAIVIDGVVGYTGGFGIADVWLGDGITRGWRETNVRFTGPAAATMQAGFAGAWAEATSELITDAAWFPPTAADSGAVAAFVSSEPAHGVTPAARMVALSFAAARRTLYIANSYFVPDATIRAQLLLAARRGVDVRLLLPDADTDVTITRWAAHDEYEGLLRSGVRIYEYAPQMMHAKTFTVDGALAAVGSLNLDGRSLYFNTETTLLVHDRTVAARLDSIFLADLEHAREIRLPEFLERSWWQRVIETLASLGSRIL
jgi:cardiolipin synthase